jgi:predicted phosphodiesterase
VDLLRGAGADTLIHLGDIGTVEVVDALCVDNLEDEDEQLEAHLVFGNTDWDQASLSAYADDLDVIVDHPLGRLKLEQPANRPVHQPAPLPAGGPGSGGGIGNAGAADTEVRDVLMFCHGHEEARMHEALAARPRYLCHGHTHRQADYRQGPTRIINPGALFRAATYTVALLDTVSDRLTFYEVDAGR